jgi:hypothetical protein
VPSQRHAHVHIHAKFGRFVKYETRIQNSLIASKHSRAVSIFRDLMVLLSVSTQIPEYYFKMDQNCFHLLAEKPPSSWQMLLHTYDSTRCHKREDYNIVTCISDYRRGFDW